MSKDALFSYDHVKSSRIRALTFLAIALGFSFFLTAGSVIAVEFQTSNFIIRNAPSYELARQFGETAEQCRKELAVLWLGEELPQWSAPCPITVKVGNVGAGGETSMQFGNGHVFDWDMRIQGSAEAILTAVLPHEITHMILASHFRERVPRWADEGAATFVENDKERQNYRRLLYQYLRTGRGIPFNKMFRMAEYPSDQMPLYAQSFSLAEFLIMQQGHQHYVDFVGMGMRTGNWPQAICDYYGYENLGELQVKWNYWVDAGCQDLRKIDPNQPIFVRESTQYVASRDFLPTREPMILAQNRHETGNPIALASLEVPYQPEVASASSLQTLAYQNERRNESVAQGEREPIRLFVPQPESNTMLAASLTPISESGTPILRSHPNHLAYANNLAHASSVVNRPHDQPAVQNMMETPPQAVVAQVAGKQYSQLPAVQGNTILNDNRLTPQLSHGGMENGSSAQTLRQQQSETPDPNVIFDWRIR